MGTRLPKEITAWARELAQAPGAAIRPLAQGANADVFRIDSDPPLVLKRYRKGTESAARFEELVGTLLAAPPLDFLESFHGARMFGATPCLITSFMPGTPVSYPDNPLTAAQLDDLLGRVFPALDQAGILNGDLNPSNILTTEDRAGIIDPEYLHAFDPVPREDLFHWINSDDWMCPVPSNRVSFEREGVGPYLRSMVEYAPGGAADALAWFTMYLKAAVPGNTERAAWLESHGAPVLKRAVAYERARAATFTRPTTAMTGLEAMRLQVYFDAFAYTYHVAWRGRPDTSEYAGTWHALRADADRYAAVSGRMLREGGLLEDEAALLAMHIESAVRMKGVLAGDDTRPACADFDRRIDQQSGVDGSVSSSVTAWLRAEKPEDVFVPADWSGAMAREAGMDGLD